MNILRMLQLTGNVYVPSFYEFVSNDKNKVTQEPAVELSINEWAEIPVEWKGSLNGQNHFLSYKNKSIIMIPANIEQPVTEEAEGGEPKSTELKDVVDAPVQNSEDAKVKQAQAILDKVTAGSRFTDTSQTGTDSNTAAPEPKTELGAETVVDSKLKETAEEKAKKIIAAVNAAKRLTDTSETGTDSNTNSPEPKSELGAEKVPEKKIVENDQDLKCGDKVVCDYTGKPATVSYISGGKVKVDIDGKRQPNYRNPENLKRIKDSANESVSEPEKLDESADAFNVYQNGKLIDTVWFTGYTAKEAYTSLVNHDGYDTDITVRKAKKKASTNESVEVAKKVIKAVDAHSHLHDADGGNNPTTEKGTSTDYNTDIAPEDMVDAARDNVDNLEDENFRTGIEYQEDTKVEVPAKVISQIDQRIKELESSIELYDDKGYNDQSMKQNALDVLHKIKGQLEMKNLEGLQQAIVLYGTLASYVTSLMPAFLPNFLATATDTQKTTGHDQEV